MPLPWEQASFRSAIDTMGALVIFLDRSGKIVEFNRACERLTGYSEAEVKGREFWDLLLLPEERDSVIAVFSQLRAGDFPNQFENHWVSKAGEARLITWSNTALVDANGHVEIIVGTGIDITERRRNEEALRASEARYRTLMEQASDGILITDLTGRYIDVNPSACQLLGYSHAEMLELSIQDIIPVENQVSTPLRLDELRAGKSLTMERPLRRKDGTTVIGEVSAQKLEDGRLMGIVRDTSERRRADEALRRRDAILEAVAFAAEEFLTTVDWERSIQAVLARLAVAANATHAYLIQVVRHPPAIPVMRLHQVWTAPGSAPVDLPDFDDEQLSSLGAWEDRLLQRQPVFGLVKDLQAIKSTLVWPVFKTLAIVPVFEGDEMWGIMGFGHSETDYEWQAPEIDALRAAANTFGAALLRWRNVKERQSQERFLTALADIARMSLQIPDIETMLQTLADYMTKIIDADDCYITLWDRETNQSIPIAASSGWREAFLATGRRPAEETVTGATLRLRRTLIVEEIQSSGYVPASVAEHFDAHSGIAVPIMAGTEPLGVFFLTFRKPHRFTAEEITRCEQATQQVTLAIAKARLLDSEQAARKRAETLQTVTEALSSSIHLHDVLDTIVSELQRVLPYDSVSVQEIQGNHSVIIACRGFPDHDQILGMRFDLTSEETPNRQVILSKQPLILDDAPAVFRAFASLHQAPAGIHSWLGVPMIVGGRVIGLISLDKQIPGFYTRDHQDLAQAFAAQAAIAIQNARLFAETQRRAAQQEALNSIITAAATAHDLPSLAAITMDRILATVSLQQGGLWAAGHYHRVGIPAELLAAIGESRSIVATKAPITVAIEDWTGPDIPEIVGWMAKPALDAGIRSSFFTPVMTAGEQIGGLVLCAPTPRPWPQEEILLLQAVAQQIGTAALRLHLAQEVRQQAQQLQQVLDTIADGMLLLDGQRRIILTNPAGREHLKLLSEAQTGDILERLGGLPIHAFLEPSAATTWRELVVEQPEWRMFQANVRSVDVLSDQLNAGWLMSITEVTQERRRQVQVEAQERLAALGRMAAGIAHDFNNILQGIIGFADIVASQPGLSQATQHRVERIAQEGRRGADLVRQILDFSRQSPPNLQPVAMEALVPYFAEPWRGMLPSNIDLAVEIDSISCLVEADASQLGHVFTNLVINGIEAMPEGGRLTVRLQRQELVAGEQVPVAKMPPGPWVAISVGDTGCGIAAKDLPRVFEPFFTTKRSGRSAGLGLARAYGIIKQHQGFVSLDSQVGEGTTVTVYLPALAHPVPPMTES